MLVCRHTEDTEETEETMVPEAVERPRLVLPEAYDRRREEAWQRVKALGITVTDLAVRIDRGRETTSRVLNGSRFSIDVLRRIEEVLSQYFDLAEETGS